MIETQQILIPKKVHIGDTAELRCTFTADSPELKAVTSAGVKELPLSVFTTPINSEDFEILNVSIAPAGVNYYQLSITFIPWKSGPIKLPDLTVSGIEIAIKQEEIVSLTKQFNTTSLQDSNAPLLLPGTAYKLWGSVIISILIIILCINLIIKRNKISFFMKNKILQMKYRKNKKKTIKKLKKLSGKNKNNDLKDSDVGEQIQHILRNYLEFRFAYPFTKVVTSELMTVFNKITQMLLSDSKYEAFGEITNAFIRTDYIRYSSEGAFLENEKTELIDNIIKNIEILEGDEKMEENNA